MSLHGKGDPLSDTGGGSSTIYSGLSVQHPCVGSDPHEALDELREFLKVVRPDWSLFNRRGTCNIDKVMAKLKSIGVRDYWDLMQRVEDGTINEDLFAAGQVVFSKKTLDCLRNQKSFMAALEHLRAPFYRQTGAFAPVPQLHARTSLWNQSHKSQSNSIISSSSSSGGTTAKHRSLFEQKKQSVDSRRPSTAGGEMHHKRAQQPDAQLFANDSMVFNSSMVGAIGQRPATALCRRSTSMPLGERNGPVSRPSSSSHPCLRFVRTGKEHQCWTASARKDGGAEGPDASDERGGANGRSRQSQDLSGSRKVLALSTEAAEAEAESAALDEQAAKFKKAGVAMCAPHLPPRWANLTSDTLLAQGEAMLEEQTNLDEQRRLMESMSREGTQSTTRKVLTANIKHRLRDEALRESKGMLDCHFECAGIRKNLVAMANARRDLCHVKFQAAHCFGEEVDHMEKFSFLSQGLAGS